MARILVAEDEQDLALFMRRALERHGHEVTTAGDGAAAARALSSSTFELLISDIVMPVMDGIALALKVEQEFPKVRVILITGYAQQQRRAHNLDLLIDDVVPKPFTADEFMGVVERVLASAPRGAPGRTAPN